MTEEATSSAVDLGADQENLNFGVAAVDGKVVVRFDKLIQWFDMEPMLAMALAEKIIECAEEAARPRENRAIRRATAADLRKLT